MMTFTVRANAFGKIETIKVRVQVEVLPMTQQRVVGRIRVWDAVAGYFTTCHNLSDSAKRRIGKLAEAKFVESVGFDPEFESTARTF